MPVYAALSWIRVSGVARNIPWTEQRALRGELGGLILSESGAPIIMESGKGGDVPAAQVGWIVAGKPLPPNWTIQEAITGEGGGLLLTESGAPLILEGPQVGGTPGVLGPGPAPPPPPPPVVHKLAAIASYSRFAYSRIAYSR